ncbi:MAG: hypothetical protein LBK66_02010 [Spirochaetaceae bacterium]|nr:hypothetical protein [Spirochaetaceae bacterium]
MRNDSRVCKLPFSYLTVRSECCFGYASAERIETGWPVGVAEDCRRRAVDSGFKHL